MYATQVSRPFHTKGWLYEEKYDGWRMLALKEAGHVRLISMDERDPFVVHTLARWCKFDVPGPLALPS